MELRVGDITKIEADAIVNAANTQLNHAGGVAAAIAAAGGQEVTQESQKIGWVEIGKAAVTRAGNLPAKAIIHVPTIDYATGRKASLDDIKAGVTYALDIAKNSGFKTVTIPLLGAGIVGLPPAVVARNIKEASDQQDDVHTILVVRNQKDTEDLKFLFENRP